MGFLMKNIEEKVIEYLSKNEWKTIREITSSINENLESVRFRILRMKKEGKIIAKPIDYKTFAYDLSIVNDELSHLEPRRVKTFEEVKTLIKERGCGVWAVMAAQLI